MRNIRITRDVLLFTLGALGFLHELFFPVSGEPDRPTLLVICAGMMGLPLVLGAARNGKNGKD